MADLACILVALIWGFNLAVVKDALTDFSPMAFNGLRLPLAASIMVLLTFWRQRRLRFEARDLPALILFGVVGNTLYQLLFIYGVELTKAGNVALLLSSSSLFVALLSWMVGHESFSRRVGVGMTLSITGVILVITEKSEIEFVREGLIGDLLILASSVCWAAYTVFARPLMKRHSAMAFSTLTFGCGAAFFLVFSIPALARQEWQSIPVRSYLELAFSALFALALAYFLWFYGLKRLGGTRTSIYANLVPFFGVASAYLFLGEPLTLRQVSGGALIVVGTLLTRSGTRLANTISRTG